VADRSTTPPYSEEQATTWLAWLAYNMHRRELTIFQIESLQPDWLVGHRKTIIHLLLTRMLWGVWAGLLVGLLGGLLGGFQPGAQELKTRPNQGIWLTVYSSIKMGLPAGIIVGTMSGLLLQNITFGFLSGAIIILVIGGWYGGLDVIEHAIIRLIIVWRGHAPLNYARFLDYAAEELNFLQKVGGGYVFIHRYLLEHFAEIAVEKGYVDPTAKNPYYPTKSEKPVVSDKLFEG
jgi:hypothetical protein